MHPSLLRLPSIMNLFLQSDNVEGSTALIENTPWTLEPGTSQLRDDHLISYS